MSNEQLADLTQPQRDRLAFVELRVRFIGEIRRRDFVSRFGIQSAAASRDLALYKELASGNIDYDSKAKPYVLGASFQPVFDFPQERVLSWLPQGFGDGELIRLKAWVASESPSRLTRPDQPRPEITKMDYSMGDGVPRMKLRAATAGYILRKWSVDCLPYHCLRGLEYWLWLKDHLAIYGVKNAVLAPGYSAITKADS